MTSEPVKDSQVRIKKHLMRWSKALLADALILAIGKIILIHSHTDLDDLIGTMCALLDKPNQEESK